MFMLSSDILNKQILGCGVKYFYELIFNLYLGLNLILDCGVYRRGVILCYNRDFGI